TSAGEILTLADEKSITFEKVPAPTGTYAISFIAENVAGEKRRSEAIIEVDNTGLDAALRGYTDLEYGLNFRYPADWVRPRFVRDGQLLVTGDDAATTVLTVFPSTAVNNAAETEAAIRASWGDLQDLQVSEPRAMDLNGLRTYVTEYTYIYGGQQRNGTVIAVYVPDQGVGYGFDLDSSAANPADAEQARLALLASITFFDPAAIMGSSIWQSVTLAEGTVSFPVPESWQRRDEGLWTFFDAPDDPAVFIGLGAATTAGRTRDELVTHWIDRLDENVVNLAILASEPYYVGSEEWHLVVFTYDADVTIGGAFFATTDVGGQDYVFWLEAPNTDFDQLYADVFSIVVDGFSFAG
ncbi:MAG: hypothetical protein GYB65_04575, partial [Chloroflexi bacterium]|nr:hypothetical protein [Chloroflexota bacterium]